MDNLKVGCSSDVIPVPLFTELCGYGGFMGRRNRGVHDPLYCRVASFSSKGSRAIVITSDLLFMNRADSWNIRAEISCKLRMSGNSIMLCGSHTHSGPATSPCVGLGEIDSEFKATWISLAVKLALQAVEDETPVSLNAGRSVLTKKLGVNRVSRNGPTDTEIRWVGFKNKSGGIKLLIHNHGMHSVAFDSGLQVSADWPGAVNNLIIKKNIAENILFLQGACGDINPGDIYFQSAKESTMKKLSENYVADLESGLQKETEEINGFPVKSAIQEVVLPHSEATPESLRETAKLLLLKNKEIKNYAPYLTDRLEEMALCLEAGNSVEFTTDFQVIRLGDVYIYAVPGELFYRLGMDIIHKSPGKAALVAEVSNDHCSYFPTPATYEKDPDIMKKAKSFYGFFSVHTSSPSFLKTPYKSSVGPFLVDKFIKMASELQK